MAHSVLGSAEDAESLTTARPAATSPGAPRHPLVIAHRGASGYRPEHTLASYRLAIQMGADYIEPDLVSTADGVLVARHENEISATTDVASRPEFADRRTTKVISGKEITGWFTEDFTLEELKTLRAKERLPRFRFGNTIYDGRFSVPTLQEVIDLAQRESERLGRQVGIYPETKHPTYFASIGLPLEPALVEVLNKNKLNHRDAPVFIQSFEPSSLQKLAEMVDVPLVQLLGDKGAPYDLRLAGDERTYASLATQKGLEFIASYAQAIGPHRYLVVPRDAAGSSLAPTTLVADAHAMGLQVHAWTFRNENHFLATELRRGGEPGWHGDVLSEYDMFFNLGVDGVFTDFPDTALVVRDEESLV